MNSKVKSSSDIFYSLSYLSKVTQEYFIKLGLEKHIAKSISNSLLWAQARNISSHGLERIPAYAAQYKKNKINQQASIQLISLDSSTFIVDADFGFAYPAISLAVKELRRLCQKQTISLAAIQNSHHAGALGYYAEVLAKEGLISIICCNAPASIAPWGGKSPLLGTNPVAFGCPRWNKKSKKTDCYNKPAGKPLIIDMSLSIVARGKVMAADFKKESIPLGWALDKEGKPTTDAKKALEGTMLPIGEAKGYLLALMVEVLSAALIGNNFSFQASSFFDDKGDPPGLGQFILAINPLKINPNFATYVEKLCDAILRERNTRLPGSNKDTAFNFSKKNGIQVSQRISKFMDLK